MEKDLIILWKKVLEKTTEITNSSGIHDNFINFTALNKLDEQNAYIIAYNQLSMVIFNEDESIKRFLEDAFFEILGHKITVHFNVIVNDIPQKYVPKIKSDINTSLTFDKFVYGENNKFVFDILYHSATHLSQTDSPIKSPIFLYGEPGLGKTHLLCSVGNEVTKLQPTKKVLYLSATNFSNRVADAHSNKTLAEFKQFFFDLDLLLIDDIQTFKATHELAQNIFFEIFNELIANHKQIIITSDTKQDKLKNILHGRLTSRFKSGITLTIKEPEFDTALKIVMKKIEGDKNSIPFTPEVIEYIARNYKNDIRGLEGAIDTILIYAVFNPSLGKKITMSIALQALDQKDEIEIQEITPESIKKYIAHKYHITVKQLESNARTKNILYPRHIAIYLTRILLNLTYEQIAELYNKKDHTTITNSVKKIELDIKKNNEFNSEINKFINELKQNVD